MTEIVFGLVGGLSLFIYGINLMSDGLRKVAGDRIKNIIKLLTTNPIAGVTVGMIITAIIQSSSATSVLTIGFVNAGIMTFQQSLGIIFGCNIGTTITAQLIAFKLTHYALPILSVGFFLYFVCKKRFWKNIGLFLLGFGILFLGLSIMKHAIGPLSSNTIFRDTFILYSNNKFIAILIGFLVTSLFQSSSVTTGIVIALASVNLITLTGAIPIIMGCNIGTCTTSLIASIGTSINSKRTAVAHLVFNIIGTVIFFIFIGQFQYLVTLTSTNLVRQCANAHTIFNVVGTLIFLPFIGLFSRLIIKLIPGKDNDDINELKYLDEHFLSTPPLAIDSSIKEILITLRISDKMIENAIEGFFGKIELLDEIQDMEDTVDYRREKITLYLTNLVEQDLTQEESEKFPKLVHVINDIEKIADHAMNLRNLSMRKNEKKLKFSGTELGEIVQMHDVLKIMISQTEIALSDTSDIEKAKLIYNTEIKINNQRKQFKKNHINRMKNKKCSCVLSGIIFIDMINNLEKIGDFLTNIADAIVGEL